MGAARNEGDLWINPEDINIPPGIPQPVLWRMLVAPIQPARMSRGGIALPDAAMDDTEHLTYLGKVLAQGPQVGMKPEWLIPDPDAPIAGMVKSTYDIKVGDIVIFGRYAGMRLEYRGIKLVLLDDDAVMAKAESMEGFRIF